MDGCIYTKHGWLPKDAVRLEQTITFEPNGGRIIRTDKYLASNGEWVGNDIDFNPQAVLPATTEGASHG